MNKRLYITVTNDGASDRRMNRLASLLRRHNWTVIMVGRIFDQAKEKQADLVQLKCKNRKGPGAYWEYHRKLCRYLSSQRVDMICAVDYDTLPAGVLMSRRQKAKLIFDSHEFFEEVPELLGRHFKKWIWRRLAQWGIPQSDLRWTVSQEIAEALHHRYGQPFEVIRNMPSRYVIDEEPRDRALVYLGVLNEGRGLPQLIKAMHKLDLKLWLIGEGDLSDQLRALVLREGLSGQVEFLGWLPEAEHRKWLGRAHVGVNLLDTQSTSYRFSLANKFFDYVHAGLPQLTMNLPTYSRLNRECEVALLLDDLDPAAIAQGINEICTSTRWQALHAQTMLAQEKWNWEIEASKVLASIENM